MTTMTTEEILASYPQITAPTDQTGYTSNLTPEQNHFRYIQTTIN